jgi:predicted PurR-regulated permease PerM
MVRAPSAPKGPRIGEEQSKLATIKARTLGRISTCLYILTVIAVAVALWVLRGLLTPLIVAIFLMILVDAVSREVGRAFPKSPEWARVSASFVLMIVILSASVWMVTRSVRPFEEELNGAGAKIAAILADKAADLGLNLPFDTIFDGLDLKPYVAAFLRGLQHLVTDTLFVIVYLGFILASRSSFQRKFRLLFPVHGGREHAERVVERVRRGAESYIGLQTFKAIMLAAFSYVIMAVLGLDNAPFLAFLILLAAYVPLIGPALGVIVPTLLALVQFGLNWQVFAMYVGLQALVILLDNILIPRLQGERMNIDPIVVLLSLGFWSLIFGAAGALLSTPLTVVVISLAAEAPGFRWLAIVLSGRGESSARSRADTAAAEPAR